MPDQLRRDALGAYGNRQAATPNVDRFAETGVTFSEAFCQHSVCSPSRASIFTGWYPHVAGHRSLFYLLQAWEPNFLRQLRDAGYHVAWLGERGDTFAPGVTEESVDEYGWIRPPDVAVPQARAAQEPPPERMERALYRGSFGQSVYDGDEATIQTTEAWLRAKPPEPWAALVALYAPHPPFGIEEPWASMHERARMPAPRPLPDGGPGYIDELRVRGGWNELDAEDWAEIVAVYYGMVSRVDAQFGRVLAALEESGAAVRTATVFFTDHGEYLGDYELVEKWPSGLHDCLVHVPLIISAPGCRRGESTDALVELVDVMPTLLELAGVPGGHTHFGRSLLPLLRGEADTHRDAAFSEGGFLVEEEPHFEPFHPPPYHVKTSLQHELPALVGKAVAIRTRRWTYVYRLYEQHELYDREADPGELVNLIGRPELAETERELRDRILEFMVSTGDVFPWNRDPRWPAVEGRRVAVPRPSSDPPAT
jgi:arylsulfatase A-like enzyme